jgi:acyl-CoA-binding protein
MALLSIDELKSLVENPQKTMCLSIYAHAKSGTRGSTKSNTLQKFNP